MPAGLWAKFLKSLAFPTLTAHASRKYVSPPLLTSPPPSPPSLGVSEIVPDVAYSWTCIVVVSCLFTPPGLSFVLTATLAVVLGFIAVLPNWRLLTSVFTNLGFLVFCCLT